MMAGDGRARTCAVARFLHSEFLMSDGGGGPRALRCFTSVRLDYITRMITVHVHLPIYVMLHCTVYSVRT